MNREDVFGTDPHKLVRPQDPDTSHEAAHAVNNAAWARRVLHAVARYRTLGCTQDQIIDDIHAKFGDDVPYSTITARFKQLHDKRMIAYTGERRKGHSGRSSMVRVARGFYLDPCQCRRCRGI
jgi:hypothetical protein